jgi:hypothetical protein
MAFSARPCPVSADVLNGSVQEDVYICYSCRDQDFVRALHDALEERDKKAWVDYEDIVPTEDWVAAVFSGIERADAFFFVISPDSCASEICSLELAHAVENNKRIVPILYRDVDDTCVPPDVASHEYILVRESDDKALGKLIETLDIDPD